MNLKTILRLIDPRTLVASTIPIFYGSISAWYLYGKINLFYLVLMLIALLLVQSSANMFNDYSDFSRNADNEDKGTEKALVNGEITPKGVLKLILVFTSIALLISIFLAFNTTLSILIPISIGGLVIYLYSGGPKPICYTPLGELVAGLTMGALATATIFYIQSQVISYKTIVIIIPTTCFISMLLLSNNLSDWKEDKAAGRDTLPILFGVETAENIWLFLLFLMYLSYLIFAFLHIIPLVIAAIGIATFPFSAVKTLLKTEKQNQNKPVLMKLAGMVGLRFHVVIIILMLLLKLILQSGGFLNLGLFYF